MRAWQITDHQTAPTLQDLPLPAPGPGEALVRVAACGLNFADLLMAKGTYQDTPPLPFTLGLEYAGTVVALGPSTAGPAAGTRVAAYAGHGGLADHAVVPVARLVPLPDAMPFEVAAGFQIAYGTSHLALTHKARMQPGETLFVTGAAGGVGLTAVEIGKRMGARVVASARGADKLAVAAAAGADVLIDSDAPDLKGRLRGLGGVDVVYDTVGGAGFDAALRAIRPEGRMLAIGFAGGAVPQVPANILLVRNASVMGFWWGAYADFAPDLLTGSLQVLMGWYAAGQLAPHLSHVLPMDHLPEGLDLLRRRAATGKVVIRVSLPPQP
ncbi:MAG: NADPH:quinone oxidoreductase family protein [Pseudomonadota bacterium]